jgi:hypothetical protein
MELNCRHEVPGSIDTYSLDRMASMLLSYRCHLHLDHDPSSLGSADTQVKISKSKSSSAKLANLLKCGNVLCV